MKKLITPLSAFALFIFTTASAHAANFNPCPSATGGGYSALCGYNTNTITKVVSNGITILFIVATVAALFFLVFGGIKWITSGGDKANLEAARNMLVAAAIGLVLTLLSYLLLNVVLELFGLPKVGSILIPSLVN